MTADSHLSQYPFIAELSPDARQALRSQVRLREVPPRTALIHRGQDVGGVYLVESGSLRVYYIDRNGREGTLYWVEPGDSCVLAVNAVFNRVTYPAWVETDSQPTRLAIIPAELYRQLYASEQAVRDFTFGGLSRRVFELMTMVEQTATFSQEQRLAGLLLRWADWIASISSSLGVQRYTWA